MLGRTFSEFLRHGSFEAMSLLLISRQLLYFNKLYVKQFCLHHQSSVLSLFSHCFSLQCTLDYVLLVASNTTGVCSMWTLKISHTPAALRSSCWPSLAVFDYPVPQVVTVASWKPFSLLTVPQALCHSTSYYYMVVTCFCPPMRSMFLRLADTHMQTHKWGNVWSHHDVKIKFRATDHLPNN